MGSSTVLPSPQTESEALEWLVGGWVVVGRHPVVNDKDMVYWSAVGASSWPTLALVSPKGTLLSIWAGEGGLLLVAVEEEQQGWRMTATACLLREGLEREAMVGPP